MTTYIDHITVKPSPTSDGVTSLIHDREAVSFVQEQMLTDAQKTKGRYNIGAASEEDVDALENVVGAMTTATDSDEGKALIAKTVTNGKVTEWEFGETGASADPEDIAQAVTGWLDDHPEATTTVQDGSITYAKLDNNLKAKADDVDDLKSQIDIENLTDAHLKKAWRSDKNYYGLLKVYPFPDSSFNEIGVKVFSDGKNFLSDYSHKDHMVSGGLTYYYSPSGNNNNPGTREKPRQYPLRPYTDGATHIFMDGTYTRGQIPSVNKSANFVAEHPGKAILVNSDHYNYTYDSGVYYTARTSVLSVLIKIGEVYRPLDAAAGLEACKATPFSFYSGNPNVYINVAGVIVPTDDNTFLNIGTGLPLLSVKPDTGDINVYFDGFVFAGGHVGGVTVENTTDYTPTVYFNNCKFLGAYTTQSAAKDALSVLGGIAFLSECEAAFARKDGFNYHAYNGKVPRAFEINCISHNNGFNGWDNTDNGSTIHNGGIVIRINGVYYGNKGANVADVHEGTKSLNLGCLAFNSLSTETGADSDFSAQQAGTTMWLDECKGYGSDWTVYAYTGTTMYLHNVEKETTNGGGTIDQAWNPWQS